MISLVFHSTLMAAAALAANIPAVAYRFTAEPLRPKGSPAGHKICKQKSPDNAGLFYASGSGRRFNYDVVALWCPFLHELDHTMCLGEQRMVTTDSNIFTRVKTGATLANDDGACLDFLAAIYFYAQSFRF
jgi:hypothetical protein